MWDEADPTYYHRLEIQSSGDMRLRSKRGPVRVLLSQLGIDRGPATYTLPEYAGGRSLKSHHQRIVLDPEATLDHGPVLFGPESRAYNSARLPDILFSLPKEHKGFTETRAKAHFALSLNPESGIWYAYFFSRHQFLIRQEGSEELLPAKTSPPWRRRELLEGIANAAYEPHLLNDGAVIEMVPRSLSFEPRYGIYSWPLEKFVNMPEEQRAIFRLTLR